MGKVYKKGFYIYDRVIDDFIPVMSSEVLVDNITIKRNNEGKLEVEDEGITFAKFNSDLTKQSLANDYYFKFSDGTNTYYTKTIVDGENIDVYAITIANNKITAITLQETKGTLANGILSFSSVEYTHDVFGDGFYVVGDDEILITISALQDILENAGKVNDIRVNGASIVENKIADFEVPTQEEIEELFDDIDSPDAWEDDEPYTGSPQDTDTLDNVDLTNRKVKKITFANLFSWILTKISGICEKGIQVSGGKLGLSNSITVPTEKRILQATYNEQGQVIDIENEFNWSNNYVNSAENQLFTRKGANDMYVNYLKSTNGTLTKNSVITNDYSHYVKCGNIYQLSIGFQNSSDIAKDALLYTLPETISSSSIEMYIIISTVAGDTRVLQCGGGTGGNVLKAKSIIPAGYWFGSAIFVKV